MFLSKRDINAKIAAFLYDHHRLPDKGRQLRRSYQEVEKMIRGIISVR